MANSIQFEGSYSFNLEIIAGCTPMPNSTEFWRADVSVDRLQKSANGHGAFIFVFVIKGREPYAYGISAKELMQACEQNSVSINTSGTPRYQLYISYTTGEVFKSVSKNALVVKLHSSNA